MNSISQFTHQYQLSKTLRFELVPVGKTKENIEKNGYITRDFSRSESYKKVKRIIDEYHKAFIELALKEVKLQKLDEFAALYYKTEKTDEDKKAYEKLQDDLRKQISTAFNKSGNAVAAAIFKNLFLKELIKDDLMRWVSSDEDRSFVAEFKDFTTYFTGFHENRKNIYKDEAISTAIPFRLIHDNLPKFLDNIKVFEKAKENGVDLANVANDLESVMQGLTLDEVFTLDFFNQTLTQKGIEFYNIALGGIAEKGNKKRQGVNEKVNLFNQNQEKKNRVPRMKPLFKQILSDRETSSFVLEPFKDDNEMLESIEKFYQSEIVNLEEVGQTRNIIAEVSDLLKHFQEYSTHLIYLKNDTSLTNLSQHLFGDWSLIKAALADWHDAHFPHGSKEKLEKYEERKEKWLKKDFSIQDIDIALASFDHEAVKSAYKPALIESYFAALTKKDKDEWIDLRKQIDERYQVIRDLLNTDYQGKRKLAADKENVSKIKAFLDSLMDLLHFIKPLMLKDTSIEKDELFYGQFIPLYEQLNKLIPVYNKVRNYLTQKPYSTEKIKLNFENSTLLDGWDVNKEEANTGLLFVKQGHYYLGIMDKKHNKVFRNIPKKNPDNGFNKVNYKLLPGASKMLPKVFFSDKNIKFYNPSEKIIDIRNHGSHTKNGNPQEGFEKKDFNLNDCHAMIDFFKISINKHEDWKNFGFNFSPTSSYQSVDEFYKEVESQGYTISYTSIDDGFINQLVDEGKLYLFRIHNKDFSPHSKGKPNLHTLYWKMLFDERNLSDVVYKLNGQAEIFYRKASLNRTETAIHKAGEELANKNPENEKRTSTFAFDLIKNKRFTEDKFQFHVPITLNFKAAGNANLNEEVRKFLQQNPNVHIIGLDRGERHLIYLTLINQKGEIILQQSLNTIVSDKQKVNYQELLHRKEGDRDEARKNWSTIENIKELKEGYISQVVHKVAQLMVQYNAIVVMEDLNFGFKRGRQKVEKQVYQKFEKMLIDKLNYLVFKENDPMQTAGVLKALQLANKFESFQKLGKQSGFIFYVPAALTSKIDPATGFVNMLNTKYESISKAQDFFSRFDSIRFNSSKDYFEFSFDYNHFHAKAAESKSRWTVCTQGEERYRYNPQTKGSEKVNVTAELKKLFDENKISYSQGEDLQKAIVGNSEKKFHSTLLHLLGLTLSLRHTISGTEVDYILSPVSNSKGNFFDSRNAGDQLPANSDANGAYNIARKGLMLIHKINEASDLKKLDLKLDNASWLRFAQTQG